MPTNIVPAKGKTFKTIKTVENLIYSFRLSREFYQVIKTEGGAYQPGKLTRVSVAHEKLTNIKRNLERWSRSHRRLHGRPAVIDEFLLEHAAEIRAALLELEEKVNQLDRPYYHDGHPDSLSMAEVFQRGRAAIQAMWALDLTEDEAREIRRTEPKPEPEAPAADHPLVGLIRNLLDEYECPWGVIAPKPEEPKAQRTELAPLDAAELIADIEKMLG